MPSPSGGSTVDKLRQGTPVVRELGHDVHLEDQAHVHDRMVEELGYFIDVRKHVQPKVFIHGKQCNSGP